MKLKTFFTVNLMLMSFWVMAQNITITGSVFFGQVENAQPLPQYPVFASSTEVLLAEATTDDSGNYFFEFSEDQLSDWNSVVFITVYDFCTGEQEVSIVSAETVSVFSDVNLNICSYEGSIDPPTNCQAFFTYEQIGVAPYEAAFFDLSFVYPPASSWQWDFGDGTSSNEPNPTHEWAEPGEYEVTLTIANDSCSATFTSIVLLDEVVDCNCPEYWEPVCVLSATGDTITFSNICFAICEGFTEEDVFDCEWEDPCDCDSVWDPVCVLSSDGMIISFPNECIAICEGFGPASFVDCEYDCDCPDDWDPVCVISEEGENQIFLNACWAECFGYDPESFGDCSWGTADCYADFYVTSEDPINIVGLEVVFVDVSYISEGEIISWSWDFGDGTTSDEQNPSHEYAEEGVYEVSLEIETSEGCTSVYFHHLFVADEGYYESPDCQAMFYIELANEEGTSFAFYDSSIGENLNWLWDFGDGNNSNEQNPTHTYETPGLYFVNLTVWNEECSSTVTLLVFSDPDVWYENECLALFVPFIGGDPATGIGENFVFFLNMSSPDAVSFNWDFGDGNTRSESNPNYEYETGGTYGVTLTITTADGCTNAFTATITIGEGDDEDGFTGTPQYSLTTDVSDVEAISETAVFPNPVSNNANFRFNLAEAGNYSIDLIGLDGSLLVSQRGSGLKGVNNVSIDVDELADGLYFARIQSGTATTTLKVVKD